MREKSKCKTLLVSVTVLALALLALGNMSSAASSGTSSGTGTIVKGSQPPGPPGSDPGPNPPESAPGPNPQPGPSEPDYNSPEYKKTCGNSSIGVTSPARTWYLAEGATEGGFETWVVVQNPGDETANVNLLYMTDKGEVAGPNVPLAPKSRISVRVGESVKTFSVSTRVTSDRQVVAERSTYFSPPDRDKNLDRLDGTSSIGVTSPAGTWYLAEGATEGGFQTWVLVQNPGDQAANVNLLYMTDKGPVVGPTLNLAPRSRQSVRVDDTVKTFSVSTRVTSDQPVVAERSTYFCPPGHDKRVCAHSSIGVTEPGQTWYLAEGATNGGFETWVVVQNPGDEAATVSLDYMTAAGKTIAQIAKERGIPLEKVSEFLRKAIGEAIAQALEAGKITAEEAERLKSHLDEMVKGLIANGPPPSRSLQRVRELGVDPESVVAEVLGITVEELKKALQGGKTVAGIAKERGVPLEKVADALRKAIGDAIARAEKDGKITAEEAKKLKSHVDEMVRSYIEKGPANLINRVLELGVDLEGLMAKALGMTVKELKAALMNVAVEGPTFELAPGSRRSVNIGETVVTPSVSTQVSSDRPVVAEVSVYFMPPDRDHWTCASSSIGVTGTATNWYLAEGATSGGFETWVLMQNPGEETATVSLGYLTDKGAVEGPTLELPPKSRRSVSVDATVRNYDVSTTVISDKPVVAERSVYLRTKGRDDHQPGGPPGSQPGPSK